MTAEANLFLKDKKQQTGYLVPIQAILPAAEAQHGYAFVYDPGTSTVKKTPIRYGGGLRNKAAVYEGLKPGDLIAVAGVSFLADGLKVKLLEQKE
jgi:multidrug efflux pump subunit AcrA (membrane-fusion protein)